MRELKSSTLISASTARAATLPVSEALYRLKPRVST